MIITHGVIDWLIENGFPPLYFWSDTVCGFKLFGNVKGRSDGYDSVLGYDYGSGSGFGGMGSGNGFGDGYGFGDGNGFGGGFGRGLSNGFGYGRKGY